MKEKIDKFWFGCVLGIIIPPIALYCLYLWANHTNTFFEFISKLSSWNVQTDVFLWCLIPLALIFAFFYFKHYDNAGKGLIFPTMIYTIILIILDL